MEKWQKLAELQLQRLCILWNMELKFLGKSKKVGVMEKIDWFLFFFNFFFYYSQLKKTKPKQNQLGCNYLQHHQEHIQNKIFQR